MRRSCGGCSPSRLRGRLLTNLNQGAVAALLPFLITERGLYPCLCRRVLLVHVQDRESVFGSWH